MRGVARKLEEEEEIVYLKLDFLIFSNWLNCADQFFMRSNTLHRLLLVSIECFGVFIFSHNLFHYLWFIKKTLETLVSIR